MTNFWIFFPGSFLEKFLDLLVTKIDNLSGSCFQVDSLKLNIDRLCTVYPDRNSDKW